VSQKQVSYKAGKPKLDFIHFEDEKVTPEKRTVDAILQVMELRSHTHCRTIIAF